MFKEKAHDITSKIRTQDVIISDDIQFKDLLLSLDTLKGLEISGFKKPSPIQKKAIPLGRCGFDLIVQAKSGTGKTCVFAVIALEVLQCYNDKLQVLILSPTREISFQIKEVISSIGQGFKHLKVRKFIGGTPLSDDRVNLLKCQVAVGTPGRVKHLIVENIMKLDSVKLFVLDEADKLMNDNFRKDVSFIYLQLPKVKQSIAVSATFPPSLEKFVTQYMTNPVRIRAGTAAFLLGIRQFVTLVPHHLNAIVQFKNKLHELVRILSLIPFNQCLVFSNYQSRGESICSVLNKMGWPAVCINGSQQQKTRLKTISSLKNFRFRVLVSTDLTSRGIDAENINLVVNLDLPYDSVTYMHRIGRAGRYGTRGLALTIIEEGSELIEFQKMLNEIGGKDFSVSLFPKGELNFNIWEVNSNHLKQIFSIDGDYKNSKEKNCVDKKELTKSKNFKQSSPKGNEEVEFLEKLNASNLCSPENYNLKNYSQLLKLMENYKKSVRRIEVNASHKNLSSETIHLNSSPMIINLDTIWKNFKQKVEEIDLPPKAKVNCEEFNFSIKKNKSEEEKSSQNYNKFYAESEQRNGDSENVIEDEEEEEINIKTCNSSLVNSNEKRDINKIIDDVCTKKPSKEKGERNAEYSNNSYLYLNIKKDATTNNVEYEDFEEELGDREGSITNLSNSYFYSNEKKDITSYDSGENGENEELDGEEESDCEDDPCDQNSVFFRNWYSLCYLQMFTIRQYISYVKQFNYYNEIINQLRR